MSTITAQHIANIAHLFATRDLSAETRPAYRARLEFLAVNPDEVASLTDEAASALIGVLRVLPAVLYSDRCNLRAG